ncbi:hypothetical protein AMATHDRAFT_142384 [Amanita thiersii Skay4041]|uniref:DUF1746 domain-containing protein n=1 Tax=Amanita thiersii Skay4041 TaxID=703135 RepID=A0A2A9NN59_9AGAR|nr:hypothetical protein AMATHDRAFT_142384 [Amanita thiersii Skay4041]
MLKRYHAQRQHIISSFDALLYQLHTLSFFLAPSLLSFICRIIVQSQFTKPKEHEMARGLRFYLAIIILFNGPSVWNHTTQGSLDDRAVVLDFVGLAYAPSKLQLVMLDLTIIFFQLLLTTVAYETTLAQISPELDILSPAPSVELPSHTPSGSSSASSLYFATQESNRAKDVVDSPQYIIDLRFRPIIARLRNPPTIRPPAANTSLPLPNTAPWSVPTGVGMMLIRAGGRMRPSGRGSNRATGREARVPGSLDTGIERTNG